MAGKQGTPGLDITGAFFYALFVPWLISVGNAFFTDGRHDLWPILAGFLVFQACNFVIYNSSPSLLPRLQLSSLSLFTNTAVSLIHSTVVGLSVTVILMKEWIQKEELQPIFKHEELFFGCWPGTKFVLCFSSGYFVYDQLDMLRRCLYNPKAPSLLVHHVVLLVCFTMALYRNVTINYLILTLICELHSIFLHLRRVFRMAGLRNEKSILVLVEWSLNWFTFFTSRIIAHTLITIKLILDVSKFPSGVEWPLAITGMLGLNVLNTILGLDLYKAFEKELSGRKTDKQKM